MLQKMIIGGQILLTLAVFGFVTRFINLQTTTPDWLLVIAAIGGGILWTFGAYNNKTRPETPIETSDEQRKFGDLLQGELNRQRQLPTADSEKK